MNCGVYVLKVILPLARVENAFKRSAGYSPMLTVAGKPIISHILEQVLLLKPEEIIFIVADYDKAIINHVKNTLKVPFRFIKQKSVKGSAHAIYGAKSFVQGEVLILFSDTLFAKSSLKNLSCKDCDAIIWVSDVEDPRMLGVVFMDGEYASKLIEKPDEPVSHQAMIGLYLIKDAQVLFSNIKYLLDNNITTKGEFHLTDALQLMINKNMKLTTRLADSWIDVDAQGGVLRANDYLCKLNNKVLGKIENSSIVPPVFIDKGALVKNSVIGPNVSIGAHSKVMNAVVKSSIISCHAQVKDSLLAASVISDGAILKGRFHHINVLEQSKTLVD